jgi:DNA-directed RNA polymerase specialized sigma24 family protein
MDYFRSTKKNINLDITDAYANRIQFDTARHMTSSPNNWNVDPEKATENKELAQVLAKFMNGLSEKFHRLFVLKEIEVLSSEEICYLRSLGLNRLICGSCCIVGEINSNYAWSLTG